MPGHSLNQNITRATLVGKDVALRPVAPDDASAAYVLLKDREPILRWLVWRGPEDVGELEHAFAAWGEKRGADDGPAGYWFAIVARTDEGAPPDAPGRFVGTMSVRSAAGSSVGDLGYWLAEDVWGRGYATEAIRLMAYFCFRHVGSTSLCAWVFVGNVGSRRALEKNGFTLVRTAAGRVERDGQRIDEWYFVLLRDEWERDGGAWNPEFEDVATDSPV